MKTLKQKDDENTNLKNQKENKEN